MDSSKFARNTRLKAAQSEAKVCPRCKLGRGLEKKKKKPAHRGLQMTSRMCINLMKLMKI